VAGDPLYNLACACALAAAAAKGEPAAADRYAARAVELLTRAHDTGFFKDPAHAGLLRKDPDLAALAGREDFRELCRRVGM
jgi:hypothetical protein